LIHQFSGCIFQANGKLIIEGVLRVFWGLKNPITLAPMYSRNDRAFKIFHAVQNSKLSRAGTMKPVGRTWETAVYS
jgi:hypothetical protein